MTTFWSLFCDVSHGGSIHQVDSLRVVALCFMHGCPGELCDASREVLAASGLLWFLAPLGSADRKMLQSLEVTLPLLTPYL